MSSLALAILGYLVVIVPLACALGRMIHSAGGGR